MKSKFEQVKELIAYSTNDCGGCETCIGIFDKYFYENLEKLIGELTEEEREEIKNLG